MYVCGLWCVQCSTVRSRPVPIANQNFHRLPLGACFTSRLRFITWGGKGLPWAILLCPMGGGNRTPPWTSCISHLPDHAPLTAAKTEILMPSTDPPIGGSIRPCLPGGSQQGRGGRLIYFTLPSCEMVAWSCCLFRTPFVFCYSRGKGRDEIEWPKNEKKNEKRSTSSLSRRTALASGAASVPASLRHVRP